MTAEMAAMEEHEPQQPFPLCEIVDQGIRDMMDPAGFGQMSDEGRAYIDAHLNVCPRCINH